MEPREYLHRIVDALPDTTLQIAVRLLVSLQAQPSAEKKPLLVADLGWTPEQVVAMVTSNLRRTGETRVLLRKASSAGRCDF